jgi:hypothetical protein
VDSTQRPVIAQPYTFSSTALCPEMIPRFPRMPSDCTRHGMGMTALALAMNLRPRDRNLSRASAPLLQGMHPPSFQSRVRRSPSAACPSNGIHPFTSFAFQDRHFPHMLRRRKPKHPQLSGVDRASFQPHPLGRCLPGLSYRAAARTSPEAQRSRHSKAQRSGLGRL